MTRSRLLLPLLCLGLPACKTEGRPPHPALERMVSQARFDPYEESPFFADGRAMRAPPPGTIPRERATGTPAVLDGVEGGAPVARTPVPVTRDLLELGRRHFDVFCAACHGLLGDGASPVARRMTFRPAPSLHLLAEGGTLSPGRIYQAVTRGFGLMPSYSTTLTLRERWAVTAYVEALILSQRAQLEALPQALRDEAARILP